MRGVAFHPFHPVHPEYLCSRFFLPLVTTPKSRPKQSERYRMKSTPMSIGTCKIEVWSMSGDLNLFKGKEALGSTLRGPGEQALSEKPCQD